MNPTSRRSRIFQSGFTLVELMVGLTIGMLAVIIIIQVMSVFEAQRNTTTGSADAQTNGGIALYTIGREMQMAGYPLLPVTNSALECTTLTFGATGITGISPVTITDGVAATGVNASDTITIRYGNSPMGGVPSQITAMVGNAATIGSNLGCQVNDITMVNTTTTCAMSSATAVSAAGVSPITVTLQNTSGAAPGANLACLGAWNEITYRVNAGNLERCDRISATANGGNCNLVIPNVNFVPSVVGVVNIQAQYGISATTNSNQITQWVEPNGATWAAPTVANRNLIKAIRIAIVARNAKIEAPAVTSACSSTTAAAPTGLCAWEGSVASPAPVVDLSAGDTNWARYRYRVFQTIVPLRNVIWSKDTL